MPIKLLKKDDTSPTLVATLEINNQAVDLTGVSSVVIKAFDPKTGTEIVNGACTVTDALNGVVSYSWNGSDTSSVGHYLVRFIVTFADSSILSVPNEGWNHLRITNKT